MHEEEENESLQQRKELLFLSLILLICEPKQDAFCPLSYILDRIAFLTQSLRRKERREGGK